MCEFAMKELLFNLGALDLYRPAIADMAGEGTEDIALRTTL